GPDHARVLGASTVPGAGTGAIAGHLPASRREPGGTGRAGRCRIAVRPRPGAVSSALPGPGRWRAHRPPSVAGPRPPPPWYAATGFPSHGGRTARARHGVQPRGFRVRASGRPAAADRPGGGVSTSAATTVTSELPRPRRRDSPERRITRLAR